MKIKKCNIKIPHKLLDAKISNMAKWTYIILLAYVQKNNLIQIKLKDLTECAGLKERQIWNWIKILIINKLICEIPMEENKQIKSYQLLCHEPKYVRISSQFMYEKGILNPSAKIFYIKLKQMAQGKKKIISSVKKLTEVTGISRTSVVRMKTILEKYGCIKCNDRENSIEFSDENGRK